MVKLLILTIFIAVFLLLGLSTIAEELHIDKDGNFHIEVSPVASTNNNFLVVTVWGTKWSVFIDKGAKVLAADELDLELSNIKAGDLVTIDGKYNAEYKYIDVKTLIDMSVGMPKPKVTTQSVAGISQAVTNIITKEEPKKEIIAEVVKPVLQNIIPPKVVTRLTKYLKLYMTDLEVKFLQEYLVKNGLLTADNATGYFGRVTRSAVQAFQRSRGLEPLGAVGPQTRAIINGEKSALPTQLSPVAKTVVENSSVAEGKKLTRLLKITYRGGEVKILQEFLISQGLLTADNVTGVFGSQTESAVKAFQKSQGVEETGMVGPATRVAINALIQ